MGDGDQAGGAGPARAATAVAVLFGVLAVVSAGALALGRADDSTLPAAAGTAELGSPERHTGPQGRVGQFVAECAYSHSAPDDPIVHHGQPGRSHRHDFYGAESTDASSTAAGLEQDPTTCDKQFDTAAYWQPTLYDHGEVVEPVALNAYYRAAPGVEPTQVVPYPFGLELIAGDQTATSPQDGEAAGWACGTSTRLSAEPPDCPENAPLHMLLTFPDCWDGEHLRAEDFRSHAVYSDGGGCPAGHPVHVPQLTVSIKFPVSGTGHDLTLASGSTYSVHGDFLNAWNPEGLRREVEQCIHRDAVCDLVSNRAEESLFQVQ